MTYVQGLADVERNRRLSERVGNGVKPADLSMAESARVDAIAERVVEVIEEQQHRNYRKL